MTGEESNMKKENLSHMTEFQLQTMEKIHKLNSMLIAKYTSFVLDEEIPTIMKEIKETQEKCEHSYEEGVCIVCGRKENE